MRYIAIETYHEAPITPIKIKSGETLQFVEESNPHGDWPNWVFCKGIEKAGWVPKQILKIGANNITCLQDYDATEHNLKKGDIICAEESLNGWVYGVKEASPELMGWAPLNCLKTL